MRTNPSIFNQAISGNRDYDEAIRELLEPNHEIDAAQLCERLIVGDAQIAADVLRPVYERTQGRDGYVSLEVANDFAGQKVGYVRYNCPLFREGRCSKR